MCDGVNMFTMVSSLLTNSESFTMLAVPFFVTAGTVMGYGGVSENLMDFCEMLYRKIYWWFWEQQTVFYQRSWEEFPVHPVQMQHLKRKC